MRLSIVFVALVALGLRAQTQETPRVEVFAGYSFASAGFPANPDPLAGDFRGSLQGWNASAALNINRWLGMVADFGGYYGSPTKGTLFKPNNCVLCTGAADATLHNIQTFTAGPQLSLRSSDFTVFGHVLLGGVHLREDMTFFSPLPTISDTSFAVLVGGGLDFPVHHGLVLRVQPDYFTTSILGRTQRNFRVSTGVVFHFGQSL